MSIGVKKYGKTSKESSLEDSIKCRQIVKEIIAFGVKQESILKIIEFLALELENRDHLQQISSLVKRLQEGDDTRSTLITKI